MAVERPPFPTIILSLSKNLSFEVRHCKKEELPHGEHLA
jgi:hypothetical protein